MEEFLHYVILHITTQTSCGDNEMERLESNIDDIELVSGRKEIGNVQ
jgi:hypothetical protein